MIEDQRGSRIIFSYGGRGVGAFYAYGARFLHGVSFLQKT
jgi:hypothetical protein